MKDYHEVGNKAKSKMLKEAKLTRLSRAKESGTVSKIAQKAREKKGAKSRKLGL
jgi:hypothetical protein